MIVLLVLAQLLVWVQVNGQFKWDWIKDHVILSAIILSIPTSLAYIKAQEIGYNIFDQSLWSLRLVGFSVGIISFGFYTWIFTNEELGLKNFISLSLGFFIILIQVFWK